MTDYKHLRELAEKATPSTDERYQGDAWYAVHDDIDGKPLDHSFVAGGPDDIVIADGLTQEDAEFIAAAAPQTMIALLDELEQLRRWKSEALTVHAEWEETWIAAGRPGKLGGSKAVGVRDHVATLQARIDAALVEMSDAPECNEHPDGDPITCGWKSDLIRVRRALTTPTENGENDDHER